MSTGVRHFDKVVVTKMWLIELGYQSGWYHLKLIKSTLKLHVCFNHPEQF